MIAVILRKLFSFINNIIFAKNGYKNYTIGHKYIHICFLIIEYYPIILSVMTSTLKIANYSLSIEEFSSSSCNNCFLFPFRISSNLNFVLLIITVIFLLLYYPIMMINQTAINLISVNWYALFFFRYGSFWIISIFINYIFIIAHTGIKLLILVSFLVYFVQTMFHIERWFALVHLSNKNLSNKKINYPFD